MLWTLLSKEPPPAPDPGAQDTGHGRGRKAGLSLNWAVPHVLVKDVPDFEQLSPELEAGTARSSPTGSGTQGHAALGAWAGGALV